MSLGKAAMQCLTGKGTAMAFVDQSKDAPSRDDKAQPTQQKHETDGRQNTPEPPTEQFTYSDWASI